MEDLSLDVTQVQFTTQQMSPDGTTGSPDHVTCNLATAKTSWPAFVPAPGRHGRVAGPGRW